MKIAAFLLSAFLLSGLTQGCAWLGDLDDDYGQRQSHPHQGKVDRPHQGNERHRETVDRRNRRGNSGPEQVQQQPQAQASDYAGGIINLTNAERRKAGLRDLSLDPELMAATSLRARELEKSFSHNRPDGRPYDTVLRELRVKSYSSWGENILQNMSENPADAVTQWMNSSGHRANILKSEFTHIGVGVHRSGGKTYVVQIFVGR